MGGHAGQKLGGAQGEQELFSGMANDPKAATFLFQAAIRSLCHTRRVVQFGEY